MPLLPHPRPVRSLAPERRPLPGPITPEGKARSALNGTRHGLRGSTFALLPDEDPAAWAALLDGYLARFRPADAAELACVERLAACDWREARLSGSRRRRCSPAAATRPNPTRASAGRARCPATRPRSGATGRRRWSSWRRCAPRARACPPPDGGRRRPLPLAGRADRAGSRRERPRPSRHARTRGGPCGTRARPRAPATPGPVRTGAVSRPNPSPAPARTEPRPAPAAGGAQEARGVRPGHPALDLLSAPA